MFIRTIAAAVLLVLLPLVANSATLTATWNPDGTPTSFSPNYGLFNFGTAFTIDFTDANSDGLLDQSEIDSFSGVTFKSFSSDPGVTDTVIATIYEIAGVTTGGTSAFGTGWIFKPNSSTGTFHQFLPDAFTYGITGLGTTVVPVPAAGILLLSGLAGMCLFRRRRD
jgi:hypothetical protein